VRNFPRILFFPHGGGSAFPPPPHVSGTELIYLPFPLPPFSGRDRPPSLFLRDGGLLLLDKIFRSSGFFSPLCFLFFLGLHRLPPPSSATVLTLPLLQESSPLYLANPATPLSFPSVGDPLSSTETSFFALSWPPNGRFSSFPSPLPRQTGSIPPLLNS